MKKLLLALLLVLAMASSTWAVGTHTVSSDELVFGPNGGKTMRLVTTTFVADSGDAAIPSLSLTASTAGILHGSLAGWWLFGIYTDGNHAGTEPTENSDVYINNPANVDLLIANGVNSLDNSTENFVMIAIAAIYIQVPIMNTPTVAISNNLINSATGTITVLLTAEPF